MKSIFRQDFQDPPESIDYESEMSNIVVCAKARLIATCSTPPKKDVTLHEFGFKPRSTMTKLLAASVAPSTPSSAVVKMPDRKDVYSNDDELLKTPPYIKKERLA
jgi:hypothetical protein